MTQIPTPEVELLLLCARMQVDAGSAQRISGLAGRDMDWNGFISMARRHGVIPLVHRTLSGLSAGQISPGILAKLKSLSDAIRFQNLVMVETLLRVLRALETAGITAVPYKGPALAAYLYQDISLRQFVDIDLLVRPCDALAARRVLLEQGYVPNQQISDRVAAAFVRFHCDFSFITERQILVELNWRITVWYWRLPDIPASAWNRLGQLPLAGVTVPRFAPEDLLLALSLHGCKHRWEMLKWIVDIAELLRICPDLDWRKIMSDANRGGYERMLALGLFLANELLDAHLPAHVLEAVRCKPMVGTLAAEVRNNLFDAHAKPSNTLVELPFIARAIERLDTKLFCHALRPFYFLLHRVVRPGVTALRRAAGG